MTGVRADDLEPSEIIRNGVAVRASFRTSSGLVLSFAATGGRPSPLAIEVHGTKGSQRLVFSDAFSAFRSALRVFLDAQRTGVLPIARWQTLDVVRVIEAGLL